MIKTFLKRFGRIVFRVFLSLLAFIVLYLMAAFLLSRISTDKEPIAGPTCDIFILSNGVHTDIVVPVHSAEYDWSRSIAYHHTAANDTARDWLAIGWGDKGFYLETPTWGDLKFSTAFKAAFALSHSALHTTFYHRPEENENCKRITISMEQYKRLVAYINESIRTDITGMPMHIETNANYSRYDAFYEARGSYSLLKTCNTWSNDALKACGQKACWWTPFDEGIFYQYR